MAKKPVTRAEYVEVIYGKKQWELLKELRSKTIQIMEVLDRYHLSSITHGSVARGDVSEKSDIDIFVPDPSSSFIVEMVLERGGIFFDRRVVIQATPMYALKGYLEIDKKRSVSFPLVKFRRVERDFYKFSGELSLPLLKRGLRVSGVDKRLMLIEPTLRGHTESTILGSEEMVTQLLGVSLETVLDRVHALIRRDEVGRTGVFVERELSPDETFEMVLKKLADKNPAIRRRTKLYGK